MSGSNIVLQTGPRARVVRPVEQVITRRAHIIDEGVPWTAALERDYWHNHVGKLMPGDAVEIHSADHRIVFEMRILDCNAAANPVFLDVVFRPIVPADLDLPAPPQQIPARYAVREAPGGGAYRVIDLETGEAVHPNNKDRHGATELCSEMNAALEFTAGQVRNALARVQAADPAPTRSPGAARTAAWRAKRRAAAATQEPPQGGEAA
jgi:hypothetical protein